MGGVSLLTRLSTALSGGRGGGAAADQRPHIELPDRDQVVYVIGDVHGCLRQLQEMEQRIFQRAAQLPDREHVIVVAGDMIDRGPQSAEVIDYVMSPLGGNLKRFALVGNHEEAMIDAMDSAAAAADWLSFGGHEALKSYGAGDVPRVGSRAEFRQFRRQMEFLVPQEHWDWLRGLPKSLRWRNYLVVHAGIRPGYDLEDQSLRDLISIREPFLSSQEDFGAVIVHGHTPSPRPLRYPNRIAVDTGCYVSGVLSAAILDRDSVRFLSVS
jgi:serine/threonine protein phosphatase 1